MSLPTQLVMLGDGAVSPFVIPGTTRSYSCAAGSVITCPAEDADILRCHGLIGAVNANIIGIGNTAARPTTPMPGQCYHDSQIGVLVIYGGAKTGWRNSLTGASA